MKNKLGLSRLTALCSVLVPSLFMIGGARADSITPSSYSGTLNVGDSVTINKTVTVSSAPAVQADIFFLADSTGSMGGTIANVASNASSILSTTSGLGNVQWGVGDYKDNGDTYVYKLGQAITSNTASVQTAINAWSAGGGGDYPEAGLYALQQVASSAATGWRAGSRKLAIWFGDAPSWDPAGPTGVTEAQAIAALNAQGISVLAVNVGSGGLNAYGQAARVAAATGGQYYTGYSGSVSAAILNAIETAVSNYTSVCLDTSETPAGLTAVSSACVTGKFDRSIDRSFDFTLTFTAGAVGDYTFDTYGTVDGGRVSTERDHIVVGSGSVPEPSTMLLVAAAMLGLTVASRRKGV